MPNAKFDAKSFNPEAFKYIMDRIPRTRLNEIRKSKVLVGNPDIRAVLGTQNGTGYARVAVRGLLDGEAVNYDGQTDITATSTKTFEQGVVVIGRAKAWVEKDFSFDITGGVDQQVADYWQDIDQDTILAVLKGVFSMTGGKSGEFVTKHTYSVNGNLEASTLNSATAQACGDHKKKFAMIFMHSVPATNLENLNLLTALKYTDNDGVTRDLTLYTWNGKLVIVDDGMPVEAVAATYKLTSDTALVTGKTYYTKSGTKYNAVAPAWTTLPPIMRWMSLPVRNTPAMSWVRAPSTLRTWVLRCPMRCPVTPPRTAARTPSTPASARCLPPRASPTKRPARPPSPPRMRSCPMVPTGLWSTLVRPLRASAPTSTTRLSPSPASSPEAKP